MVSTLRLAAHLWIILVLAALLPGGASAQTVVPKPRKIRVVMDNAYVPYVFESADHKLQGILVDQWRAWEEKTGVEAEIHAMPWAEALRRMSAGEFDVIDTIVETEERRALFDFTPKYATVEVPIFFRRDISGITDLPSLKGFPVGVKEADQHIDMLRGGGVTTLISFPSFDAMIDGAKAGKINVFVADAPAALYLLNRAGCAADFRQSAPIARDGLQRAVREGDSAMLRLVSEGFAAIEPERLKRIDEKWFGRPIRWSESYLVYVAYTAAAVIALMTALIAWNRALKKKVLEQTAALRESEQGFRLVLDTIPTMAWTVSADGKIDFLNRRWLDYTGIEMEEGIRNPTAMIHPEDTSGVMQQWTDDAAKGRASESEMRLRRADGEYRWFLVRTVPMIGPQGEILKWYGASTDIEDRKQAERQVQDLIDAIPQQIWSGPADGTLDYCNDRWRSFMGLSPRELKGEGWQVMLHPEDRERVLKAWRESVENGTPFEQEERHRGADGTYRWFLARGLPLRDGAGRITRWYGTNTDIEDRKRAEEQLERYTQLLQSLSRRLFEVQEEERRHLALELHDEIGQTLTAAKLNLKVISKDVTPNLADRIEASIQILDSLLGQVRQISLDLRPPHLDALGLVPALRWLADQQTQRTGLRVSFTTNVKNADLAPSIRTACFRIVQEAVTNAAKHAQATTVTVELQTDPDRVWLIVQDDGTGFDQLAVQRRPGGSSVGLLSMHERVSLLGGELEVKSVPSSGTEIRAWLPLAPVKRASTSELG